MPLSGHGRAGCYPVFTGCRYSLIQDRIVCKTNMIIRWDLLIMSVYHGAAPESALALRAGKGDVTDE